MQESHGIYVAADTNKVRKQRTQRYAFEDTFFGVNSFSRHYDNEFFNTVNTFSRSSIGASCVIIACNTGQVTCIDVFLISISTWMYYNRAVNLYA